MTMDRFGDIKLGMAS